MHRVELKASHLLGKSRKYLAVPNAPCGVESWFQIDAESLFTPFLMHRVELKASPLLKNKGDFIGS